jgi:hypothetical protein
MANRPRFSPRPLTAEEKASFKGLLEDQERWPDFEERLKQVAIYKVSLGKLLKILGRAQLDQKDYVLQESRRYALEWVEDVEKAAEKLCKLADKLWGTNGRAANMRAALSLAGWKGRYQIDFLNYAHAIEKTAQNAKKQFVRSPHRPAHTHKHRAMQAMNGIRVPKSLIPELLAYVGL